MHPSTVSNVRILNPDNTFFVADFHFDHKNIIKYCNRPFKDVDEMNQTMLNNYNKVIRGDSLVFFVGDMAFGRDSRPARYWLQQLHGDIIYLKGSHDQGIRPGSQVNATVCDACIAQTEYGTIYVVHEVIYSNIPEASKKGWIIHGHNHDARPFIDLKRREVNVGVDVTGFKPVSLTEIRAAIRKEMKS